MPEKQDLSSMFNPKSVALVGASHKEGDWGANTFIPHLLRVGFPGQLYPINPKATEIHGLKSYPSLKDLPGPVDLVIVAVPAHAVPSVLEDCVAKGCTNVHIFTSGFKETGEPEGLALERQIEDIAARGHLRVIGPNCMGLYVPSSKLISWGAIPLRTGSLAFVSQSGGLGEDFLDYAQGLGLGFSKVISYGNASGLDGTDLLEYLGDDPETKVIGMYIEGIKDGRRFIQLVREVNQTKPVVIWKGGLSTAGSQAVASHTGSLAGSEAIWDGFFEQTGAIKVGSLAEMGTFARSFLTMPPPHGRRVAILAAGGGQSVALADVCAREGLEVPALSQATRQEMRSYIPVAGNSTRNPVDAGIAESTTEHLHRTLELLDADPVVDMIIVHRHVHHHGDPEELKSRRVVVEGLIEFVEADRHSKPIVMALSSGGYDPPVEEERLYLRTKLAASRVPVCDSMQLAAITLNLLARYWEARRFTSGV